MKQMRPSTMVAIAVFVVSGVLYVFVQPDDQPVPESSPIPVFVVTTTTAPTNPTDATSGPSTDTTVPSAEGSSTEGGGTGATSTPPATNVDRSSTSTLPAPSETTAG